MKKEIIQTNYKYCKLTITPSRVAIKIPKEYFGDQALLEKMEKLAEKIGKTDTSYRGSMKVESERITVYSNNLKNKITVSL